MEAAEHLDCDSYSELHYIHCNPVTRGLVNDPAQWAWSSYRHWQTGEMGTVEIESHWTFRLREEAGIACALKWQPPSRT